MSKSKRAVRETALPGPRRRKSPFVRDGGGLRTGWLLAASLLCYAVAAAALRRGLAAVLAALFRAWGIDAANAWRAPGWARALYSWQGSLVTLLTSMAVLLLCRALRRAWMGAFGFPEFSPRGLLGGWAAGLLSAIGIAALCLLPDSVRAEWPLSAPHLSWSLPALCAVGLLSALAEEAFGKRVLYDGLRARWGRAWAVVTACALIFLSNGGYAGNALSAVNVLLLGLVSCLIYERRGLWASAGFRWGWSVANVFLLGFGGGDAAIYRLYGVSEALMTGGDGGPVYGLWATLVLAAIALWMCRDEICLFIQMTLP